MCPYTRRKVVSCLLSQLRKRDGPITHRFPGSLMFLRLVVDSISDQGDKETLLKGEHMRKENYGLVIRVT